MQGQAHARETGKGGYQLAIEAGGHGLIADEPVDLGGLGSGPAPYDLLCAALAACTSMTLRMVAQRKGWALAGVEVTISHSREADQTPPDLFTRVITLTGELSDAERRSLLDIATRCPVHKTLAGGARVASSLAD